MTACRSRTYNLDCTGVAWVRKNVERAAGQEAAVLGSLGIEAWQYLTEARRIVLDSCAIVGKPRTAAAADDPSPSTALQSRNTVVDGRRMRFQSNRG